MMSLKEGLLNISAAITYGLYYYITLVGKTMSSIARTQVDPNVTGGSTITEISEGLLNSVKGFLPELQGIGLGLTLIFLLISLIQLFSTDKFTFETLLKELTKFIAALVIIFFLEDIANLILNLGNALQDYIANNFSLGLLNTTESLAVPFSDEAKNSDIYKQFYDMWDGSGHYISAAVLCIVLILPMLLASLIMLIITYIVCFSRILELNIRLLFMPIAVGLMAEEGWRGSAGRYIKKFLALACQGAVITVIGLLTTSSTAIAIKNVLGSSGSAVQTIGTTIMGFLVVIGLMIACIQVLFKSIGIINDVFGV